MGDGLSEFVFVLAVPCLIFRTLVRADIPAVQPWGYWISYFAGVALVWSLAILRRAPVLQPDGISAVVAGFSAGQANTVLVGIPMILKAYGEEGAVPLFLLIAVHLPVTMTVATLLAEGRRASPLRSCDALPPIRSSSPSSPVPCAGRSLPLSRLRSGR